MGLREREASKAMKEIFKKIEDRRKALITMAEKSENDVAKAIYMLASEICELQKFLQFLVAKR